MRILYVVQSYLPEMGALSGRVSEMTREWVAAGHAVQVLAPVPSAPMGIIPPEFRGRALFRERDSFGVEVTRTWLYPAANDTTVRRALAWGSFATAAVITGIVASPRPDVVIGSSPQILAATAGWWIARLRRVPWVFEVRDLWPEELVAVGLSPKSPIVPVIDRLANAMYRSAKHIVVVTHSFREILASRGLGDSRITAIPNGVDLSKFEPREANPEDRRALGGDARFIVSYMGTFGRGQDLARLLDVAGRMRDRRDVAFALVGDGAEGRKLEAQAHAERLSNVRFLGVQPRDRMPALYAASDICLVPLLKTEIYRAVIPSKVFEIMGMQKPILITADGEARRIVEAAGAGRFAEPGDTDALETALVEMLADPADLARRAESGRRYVAREFDRRMLAKRYLEVLESACT